MISSFKRFVLITLGLGLLSIYLSAFIVNQYEQALVLELGKPIRIAEAGLHFKIPLVQDVVYLDKRILNLDALPNEAPTLDQKQVIVESFAKYKIIDPLKFFQTMQNADRAQQRLGPIVNANIRNTLSGIEMDTILTGNRAELMSKIIKEVNEEVQNFGIKVVDVRIKRFDLPEENSQAIFRRMQTQREQEARRFRAEGEKEAVTLRAEADKQEVVMVADAIKQATILKGQGDAKATSIYNEAYSRDPVFFDFFRSMQALTEALPHETTSYIGSADGDFFRYFLKQSGVLSSPK
ncbi:MAG: protease modulator HflC [Alphaproteobacteria bacterium]|nr:protease modulator HflC [Alphaproteobacteria bacterium]